MERSFFRGRSAAVLLAVLAAVAAGCGTIEDQKAQSVSTVAGASGGAGYFDGSGSTVRFSSPAGAAVIGTSIYVADTANHVIRRIDAATGAASTLVGKFGVSGSADDATGADNTARFHSPTGIAADPSTNTLYVCDTGNHTIRKIVASSGVVTTLAGSPGESGSTDNAAGGGNVRFASPRGIAADASGTILFVADTGNHKIRKVFSFSGATSTYAGSGSSGTSDNTGTSAEFSSPEGVACVGSDVFVADTGNHAIRRITPSGAVGSVATFAGAPGAGADYVDGTSGTLARFSSPSSLAAIGSDLYVADTGNQVVRKIDASAFVTTLAGSPLVAGAADGTGTAARFDGPKGIAAYGTSLAVADTGNHTVRIATAAGVVTTLAGNPPQDGATDATGTSARFREPAGAAVIGDNIYVADTGNHAIRKIDKSGVVTTFAGNPGVPGYTDGTGTSALFTSPQGIVAVGADLYVADSGNHAIRKIASSGTVTTFAGAAPSSATRDFVDGTGTAARFDTPRGIASDDASLFVADTGNHAIRKIDLSTADVSTMAGSGVAGFSNNATGTNASFRSPEGIAVIGTNLYVADTGNHAIRKVANSTAAPVTTFAGAAPSTAVPGYADGSGTDTRFSSPRGIAAIKSVLYVADTGNHAIRKITTSASVTTFIGSATAATTRDGGGSQALLNAPVGITGVFGTIHFTDAAENVVRKILY